MATLFFGGWDIPFTQLGQRRAVDRAGRRSPRSAMFFAKIVLLPVRLHLGALDAAAVPLRPADGARLEGHAAAGARVHHVVACATCDRRVLSTIGARVRAVRHAVLASLLFAVIDRGARRARCTSCSTAGCTLRAMRPRSVARGGAPDGDQREGARRARSTRRATCAGHAEGDGADVQAPVPQEGHDAVPRGEGQRRLGARRAGAGRTAC